MCALAQPLCPLRLCNLGAVETIIVGAGGHGRDVLVALRDHDGRFGPRTFIGFVDDGEPDMTRLDRLAAPFLGKTDELARFAGAGFVVGVGDPRVRRSLADRAVMAGLVPVTVIHRQATVGDDVTLGDGSVLCAGARVTTNVRAGVHVHVNINATVAHDVVLGDYVTLNPQAAVSGDVHLGDGATIGTGAAVRQGLAIGQGAVVGAGAAVVADISPGATCVGVPARPLRTP